jgi:hypothetical protein
MTFITIIRGKNKFSMTFTLFTLLILKSKIIKEV